MGGTQKPFSHAEMGGAYEDAYVTLTAARQQGGEQEPEIAANKGLKSTLTVLTFQRFNCRTLLKEEWTRREQEERATYYIY